MIFGGQPGRIRGRRRRLHLVSLSRALSLALSLGVWFGASGIGIAAPAKASSALAKASSAPAKTSKDKPSSTKPSKPLVMPAKAPGGQKGSGGKNGQVGGQSGQKASIARKPDDKAAKQNRVGDDVPVPADDDRDRERIRRLQETIAEILNNRTLGRLRVGLRVVSARTGRLYYARHANALMDPASNQKVLATTAALMRLGADWRFRTELSGPTPDDDGVITGNVHLRGNGDPSLRMVDLESLAAGLRARGASRIDGAVIADSRRIGDDGGGGDSKGDSRAPLVVDHAITVVRVRPGATAGAPAIVLVEPTYLAPSDDGKHGALIHNQAITKEGGRRPRISVRVGVTNGRLRVDVAGRIQPESAGVAFRRRVPHPALHAAIMLRAALVGVGIAVRDPAGTGTVQPAAGFVEVHTSAPLEVVLRKINKDSDNDWAERVLQAVGAEQRGGAPTTEKGLAVLREVIGGMGLRPGSYVPKNGSGLGHANRITTAAMADLLRALYLDPRVGPEILQSLSVGGIDGTTRNRFKGTLAARRVRAKTGTLNGKSCLSGLVGDGDDVMVFSMMVQGFRGRHLPVVRASQVGAVTAIMRYVREGTGERIDLPTGFDEKLVAGDLEAGGEVGESGAEGESDADIMPLAGEPARRAPGEDGADARLRQSRGTGAPAANAATGAGGAVGTAARGAAGGSSGTVAPGGIRPGGTK